MEKKVKLVVGGVIAVAGLVCGALVMLFTHTDDTAVVAIVLGVGGIFGGFLIAEI